MTVLAAASPFFWLVSIWHDKAGRREEEKNVHVCIWRAVVESIPGWTLPSHKGKDEDQDTASAHRQRKQWAPASNKWQHDDGQAKCRAETKTRTLTRTRARRATRQELRKVSCWRLGVMRRPVARRRSGDHGILTQERGGKPPGPAKARRRRHGASEIALGRPFSQPSCG